jgi:cell division protein FtsQ
MDGGGRLAQPLTRAGPTGAEDADVPADARPRRRTPRRDRSRRIASSLSCGRLVQRCAACIPRLRPPRGTGIAASTFLVVGALAYGTIRGGHLPILIDQVKDARNALANAVGFRIAAVSLSGQKEVSREQVLTIAGVTGRASLLFLDVAAARERLLGNPWIADATILKLYPDRLQITVKERQAFALWQKDGRVSVIAEDGTVLEPFVARRYLGLPLVVGRGAHQRAKDFLAFLDRYPDIRSVLRASILVAERRWNLRLKNGLDVRLPEAGVERALDTLVALDREQKLLTRDITAIDLRLNDRVTVRLSNSAAQARSEAFRDKKKKKGGDA